MLEFTIDSVTLLLQTAGCFAPNLTTKILARSALKQLQSASATGLRVLELGCGSGVISAYLIKAGALPNVDRICLSDVSVEAVEMARTNLGKVQEYLLNGRKPEIRAGRSFSPWKNEEFNFVINDISAISESISKVSDWFNFAQNSAGEDGIAQTVEVIKEFYDSKYLTGTLLFPVISLSNEAKLFQFVNTLNVKLKQIESIEWPLPVDLVKNNQQLLDKLRSTKTITLQERFGRLIARTTCYELKKILV